MMKIKATVFKKNCVRGITFKNFISDTFKQRKKP